MRNICHHLFLCAAALALAGLAALCHAAPARAAGVVTDCTKYGPGPGTLADALATDGLITFACSGAIVLPDQVAMYTNRQLVIDGSGQRVTLSGGNRTRLFNLGKGASLHLHNLTLTAGNADGGGAIQSAGYLTITNSALLSNTANFGGALELINGSVLIQNSTLAGNQSSGTSQILSGGGAINQYFDPSSGEGKPNKQPSVRIINSTLTNNRSVVAGRGGIWQENGELTIRYSIVAGNETGNCLIAPPNLAEQYFTTGSLDDDGSCLFAQRADPLLAPLGDNGGTPSFALLPNSPAIDAAPVDACAGTVDQRGVLRPRDGNHDGATACDLGAYEYGDRFMVAASSVDGLVGYWKFDEGGGATVLDSSGHGLTGTLMGGAVFTTAHPSLLFNSPFALQASAALQGAAAGLQVPDAAALNPPGELTVAAWVRLNSTGGVQPLVAKQEAGQPPRGYGLFIRNGALAAEAFDSAGAAHVITGEVTAGGWLHVAMTYRQAGEMVAYVNGRKVGAQAVTPTLAISSAPLFMAADGAVDDVRIYDRALTPGAVAALAAGRNCVATGTTWGDAVPDLQCALADAPRGAEVWVGPGVYRPTHGPDRTATFAIGDGVRVYGGFAGGESGREQRVRGTPQPVLSGDIGADDRVDAGGVLTAPAGLAGANALHVVSINSTLPSTVLDQVTITGGQADGAVGATCGAGCGGGVYITGGAPQLNGLRLIGNSAAAGGGAIYAEQSSALVISSTLQANRAASGGAAFWQGGSPVVANSLVAGNLAADAGGGLYGHASALRLVNVTVAGNVAGVRGGGLLLDGGGATASNILVSANTAPGEAQLGGAGAAIQASLVQGGCPAPITCAGDVQVADPLFVTPDASAAPDSGGDYRLQPTSPAIDSGDNNANFAGGTVASIAADVAGAPRIVAVYGLPPRVDLGAYEAPNAPPIFVNAPITLGTTTIEYVYRAIAIDPNAPATPLPVEAVVKPAWLRLDAQPDGSALLHGTPGEIWYGYFDVVLRSTDTLGAATEQAFTIHVLQRVYPLFLPHVLH